MKATKSIVLVYAIVSILLCIAHASTPTVLEGAGLYFLFGVVLTVGMLHGSLDYEIVYNQNKKIALPAFLLRYVLQMAAVALLWYVAPLIALLLFLAYTAWHFGDTDLAIFNIPARPWQILLYGAGITGWLLGTHLPATLHYLADLSVFTSSSHLLARISTYQMVLVAASLASLATALLSSRLTLKSMPLWVVGGILATTAYLPLLAGFTLYFGFWHSVHTLAVIQKDLQKTLKELLLLSAPFMGASVLGSLVLVVLLSALHLNSVLVLFIFISALTLPHAAVMHNLFLRYKQTA